jgi:hypothetical protein
MVPSISTERRPPRNSLGGHLFARLASELCALGMDCLTILSAAVHHCLLYTTRCKFEIARFKFR